MVSLMSKKSKRKQAKEALLLQSKKEQLKKKALQEVEDVSSLPFIWFSLNRLYLNRFFSDGLNIKKKNALTDISKFVGALNVAACPHTYHTYMNNPKLVEKIGFIDDVVYRFLARSDINWPEILLSGAKEACKIFFANSKKPLYLIVDDTPYERNSSYKAEGIARLRNHTNGQTYLGYTVLSIAISDGDITFPLTMSITTSSDKPIKREKKGRPAKDDVIAIENESCRVNDFLPEEEGTYAYDLKQKMKEQNKFERFYDDLAFVVRMLAEINLLYRIECVLSDSWFTPCTEFQNKIQEFDLKFCGAIKNGIAKYKFYENGTFQGIFSVKDKYLDEKKVALNDPNYIKKFVVQPCSNKAKKDSKYGLVFTPNDSHNSDRALIPILSADADEPAQKVVDDYSNRVQIEPMFRVLKSAWRIISGCEARKLNSINAHIHICALLFLLAIVYVHENCLDKSLYTSYFIASYTLSSFINGIHIKHTIEQVDLFLKYQWNMNEDYKRRMRKFLIMQSDSLLAVTL